jgi:hypothetical protein
VYRRPGENDEQLVDATEPVMGKIQFEGITDSSMKTQAEKMEGSSRASRRSCRADATWTWSEGSEW